jgi:hypothetical protein
VERKAGHDGKRESFRRAKPGGSLADDSLEQTATATNDVIPRKWPGNNVGRLITARGRRLSRGRK